LGVAGGDSKMIFSEASFLEVTQSFHGLSFECSQVLLSWVLLFLLFIFGFLLFGPVE
jgi:hypothetical protein